MRLLADMALPEVEEVHVVPDGLSALDLEDDAAVAERQVVVGPDSTVVGGEQSRRFIAKAEFPRERKERELHPAT